MQCDISVCSGGKLLINLHSAAKHTVSAERLVVDTSLVKNGSKHQVDPAHGHKVLHSCLQRAIGDTPMS